MKLPQPTRRDLVWLVVVLLFGLLWWRERRGHYETRVHLRAYQMWSDDLGTLLRKEREAREQGMKAQREWEDENPFD